MDSNYINLLLICVAATPKEVLVLNSESLSRNGSESKRNALAVRDDPSDDRRLLHDVMATNSNSHTREALLHTASISGHTQIWLQCSGG
jgi:hypothetical protein